MPQPAATVLVAISHFNHSRWTCLVKDLLFTCGWIGLHKRKLERVLKPRCIASFDFHEKKWAVPIKVSTLSHDIQASGSGRHKSYCRLQVVKELKY
jgi:hypothetical protein